MAEAAPDRQDQDLIGLRCLLDIRFPELRLVSGSCPKDPPSVTLVAMDLNL